VTVERTTYALHLRRHVLVAESIAELAELVGCALEADDEILLVRARQPRPRPLTPFELETVIRRLTRRSAC
jgi:hypothetical protein